MKKIFLHSSLFLFCLLAPGSCFSQSVGGKVCAFSIAGLWRSDATSEDNPVFYSFSPDGVVTLLGHSAEALPQEFEVITSAGYKLDEPAAPKRIEFTARRGNDLFRAGTTSMEIIEFAENSFLSVDAESGRHIQWERVQSRRYFLTFASRSGVDRPPAPVLAIWTSLDGRKTDNQGLGVHFTKSTPVFGLIPTQIFTDFASESDHEANIMLRLELSETEFSRTKLIYQNWERFVQNQKLPHRDPYVNVMEFIKQVVESLNRCEEKVKLEKLNIDRADHPINQLDPRQRPIEYIKIMRKENDRWHILDGMFPTDWRPELTIQGR